MKNKKGLFCALSALMFAQAISVHAAWNPDIYQNGLPGGTVSGIIVSLMNWLLILVGVVAVIAFLIAGILYLTSAGDDNKMEKAKGAMIASIIGIIVALSGYIALQAITTWLDGTY
jgi:hypothetical protein